MLNGDFDSLTRTKRANYADHVVVLFNHCDTVGITAMSSVPIGNA